MNVRADPPTITATQSFTWVLREVFASALMRKPFFAGFKLRRNQHPGPVQMKELPLLGVYMGEEVMTPDGDANAGEIRFMHAFRILFSVIVVNNDPEQIEKKLDAAFWAIMNGLWRDPYLTNLLDTFNPSVGYGNPDNTRMEGVTRGVRRHRFGAVGLNNEAPFAELQYDATITYRSEFGPVIVDDLLHIHVETVPLADDGTIPPADEVRRVITEYTFDPVSKESKP